MSLYWDADALVKHYVPTEAGAQTVTEIVSRPDSWGGFAVSQLTVLEVSCVLLKKRRGEFLSASNYRDAVHHFHEVLVPTCHLLRLKPQVAERALEIVTKLSRKRVSGTDALHLAAAETVSNELGGIWVVVSADRHLKNAAQARGFDTFDPTDNDLDDLKQMVGSELGTV